MNADDKQLNEEYLDLADTQGLSDKVYKPDSTGDEGQAGVDSDDANASEEAEPISEQLDQIIDSYEKGKQDGYEAGFQAGQQAKRDEMISKLKEEQ